MKWKYEICSPSFPCLQYQTKTFFDGQFFNRIFEYNVGRDS